MKMALLDERMQLSAFFLLTLFSSTFQERPSGSPVCSVQSVNNNTGLQYLCQWSGGTPQANLYFPVLSSSSTGSENFSLTVSASKDLDGKTVTCLAEHTTEKSKCDITARSPRKFLPSLRTTVGSDGKIVVSIHCVSEASPNAVVSWFRGSQAVTNGTVHQISNDTTQIQIRDNNIKNLVAESYTCTCRNPLGSQRREVQLTGPSILDVRSSSNKNGRIVRLTWKVPDFSLVTGFDIKIKRTAILNETRNDTQTEGGPDGFETILKLPGSAREAFINLDWSSPLYVTPTFGMTAGVPSEFNNRCSGDEALCRVVFGIAVGIPITVAFLMLVGLLCIFCTLLPSHCCRNRSRQTSVSRPIEDNNYKVITIQIDSTPHILTGQLKEPPPNYNQLYPTPSERSVALPPAPLYHPSEPQHPSKI